ncbi:ornithine cyclodeaminase family protein [Streptomyces sp. APSN-46.1]|uniref:ornithine cyclodeaminase family protein n=1 Tax=Streptomyces sp. APSN-46.1 TaxID=2929049 RepID=UPI001FB28EF1|nr:ornithine cyclodeaminase family protein [Streptomyces sp. APSN-46.1]MCJ1680477.1 ornithine cyclodeaminase family protein [Streptomyces sp. APSN-46.1]
MSPRFESPQSSRGAVVQLGAEETAGLLTSAAAADALADALRAGLDPEGCPRRSAVDVPGGQLLLMPAASGAYAGVKIAGVAPANPALGLPRITGSYLLLDGPTLRPLALLDGAALTAVRTPAVSALALRHLAPAGRPLRMVLFGSGPQAYGHLEAVATVRELAEVVVVARNPRGAEELAAHARGTGLAARVGVAADVAGADLVVCCTTAREPLFDGRLVGPGATVVAVGSHEPDARETDTALVRRAAVYVESRAAALREAGDLLVPEAEGAIGPGHITGTLADLVAGRMPAGGPPSSPQLFKSVGMAWEDLAVAVALFQAAGATRET